MVIRGENKYVFLPYKSIGFFVFFITLLLFSIFSGKVEPIVTGACTNCHTMHNSQDGVAVAYQLNETVSGFETDTTSNVMLLVSDCIGCHTSTGDATIVNNVPIIFNTSTLNNPLAGGNFFYVRTNDTSGHNVSGLKGLDPTLGITPPGGSDLSSQLTCAGEFGCHGDRTAGSNEYIVMKGAHHEDDTGGIDGTSVGLSYRFLNGILGTEDPDWEQDNINTSHNEYKGSTASATDTISYLCSQCHGKLHTWEGGASEVGTSSPWLRHPTDIALNNTGEYASYTVYNMIVPVARPDPDSVIDTTQVTPGTDIIMCLSCHRAHASPNFKSLRWDYKDVNLSTALSGCNVCHTSKD
jgi:predicted CXXCH cytochrome family protein